MRPRRRLGRPVLLRAEQRVLPPRSGYDGFAGEHRDCLEEKKAIVVKINELRDLVLVPVLSVTGEARLRIVCLHCSLFDWGPAPCLFNELCCLLVLDRLTRCLAGEPGTFCLCMLTVESKSALANCMSCCPGHRAQTCHVLSCMSGVALGVSRGHLQQVHSAHARSAALRRSHRAAHSAIDPTDIATSQGRCHAWTAGQKGVESARYRCKVPVNGRTAACEHSFGGGVKPPFAP